MKWWRGDMLSTADGTHGTIPALATRFAASSAAAPASAKGRITSCRTVFAMNLRPAT